MIEKQNQTKMKSRSAVYRPMVSCIFIVVFAVMDQLLKIWAVEKLKPAGSMDFLKIGNLDILGFRYLENTGAAFGSFAGMRWILIGVTSAMCIICLYVLFRHSDKSKLLLAALTLIIGGGIGHVIDRIFREGRVIDYLEVRLFHFAVFNFADCCVVIGVALLAVYLLFHPEQRKPEKASAEKSEGDENA